MKKRITALALAVFMVLGIGAIAANGDKAITVTPMTMTINGQVVTPLKSDGTAAEVFAYDGATYVPLRYLSELLGIEVKWDAEHNQVAQLVSDKLSVPAGPANGVYTGTAQGFGGDVVATVTIDGGKITAVKLTGDKETPAIGGAALSTLEEKFVSAGSAEVEAVSGATVTSSGAKKAVEAALAQANGTGKEVFTGLKTEKTESVDIVVVGSGISGLAAAMAAVEGGAKDVVVLEKQSVTGGTTAIAGGYLICVDPVDYAKDGIDSTLATFRTYWEERMSVSGAQSGYPDYDRWTAVVSQTGATCDWLGKNGVKWGDGLFTPFGPYPVLANPGKGRGLVDDMVAAAEGMGVKVITECTGKELTLDANGAVTGLIAETASEVITYSAKGVILCTGGSSANAEITAKYSPKVAAVGTISTAAPGCVGDGQVMAEAAGAKVFDHFFTSICATTVDPAAAGAVVELGGLTTAKQLGVNGKGERFASEAAKYYDALGSDMIQDGNAPFWYIYDGKDANVEALEKGAAAGVVAKGSTIEELAKAMGVDAATLKASYDKYAAAVKAGKDETYGKAEANLVALDTAPYYAVKFFPTTFGSQGGVETDVDGHVLDAKGNIVPGLYAAGADSNRYFYNENYVLAASLGLYATTGRFTGTAAAKDLK